MSEPAPEHRRPPASGASPRDQHQLVLVDSRQPGEPLVVATQVGHHPSRRRMAFCAAVLAPGQPPVVISEWDIPVPRSGWELRGPGLWASHICETPFEHWSYGLEAFALSVDDPVELLGHAYGERVPLGWELEFEATGAPVEAGAESYWQRGLAHGLVLFAGREVEIEARAVRSHRWGSDPFPAGDGLDDGSPTQVEVALPTPDGTWWVARTAGGVRHRLAPL